MKKSSLENKARDKTTICPITGQKWGGNGKVPFFSANSTELFLSDTDNQPLNKMIYKDKSEQR